MGLKSFLKSDVTQALLKLAVNEAIPLTKILNVVHMIEHGDEDSNPIKPRDPREVLFDAAKDLGVKHIEQAVMTQLITAKGESNTEAMGDVDITPGIVDSDTAHERTPITAPSQVIGTDFGTNPPTPIQKGTSGFKFGRKSIMEMRGIHPLLVQFSELTLSWSTQDFMIYDGLRTPEEQKALKAAGKSQTLNSMHLKQADGFGHAVDFVPVVGMIPKWDWNLIPAIVIAAKRAAEELKIANKIVWGGAWDRRLRDLNPNDIMAETKAYAARHAGSDFLDGPHFELRL